MSQQKHTKIGNQIPQLKGQTNLDNFVQTPPTHLSDPKQCTPPNVGELNPSKKLIMEDETNPIDIEEGP